MAWVCGVPLPPLSAPSIWALYSHADFTIGSRWPVSVDLRINLSAKSKELNRNEAEREHEPAKVPFTRAGTTRSFVWL